jgi:hypothetical protein
VLCLLDADTVIRADSTYYPLKRFPIFWQWLRHNGSAGSVKIPVEQFEEIVAGAGELVDWLNEQENKQALLLAEESDPALVAAVTADGYAPDLNEAELVTLGRDPFLIAYGFAAPGERCIVSFETSAPSKVRANRKVPDVCTSLGVRCITLFELIKELDFTTDWHL